MSQDHVAGHQPVVDPRIVQRLRSLLELLRDAGKEYVRDYAKYFAVATAHYALVSLVPLLVLLLALLAMLLRLSTAVGAWEAQVLRAIQGGFGEDVRETVEQLLQGMQQQSVFATIVSALALAVSSSLVVRHLRQTFRALWRYAPPLVSGSLPVIIRMTVFERVMAFGMVLAGVVLVPAAFVLVFLVDWLSDIVGVGWLIALPVSLLLVPGVFAFLFIHLPPVRLPWRDVVFATLLCTCAWLLGVELLVLYGTYFGNNVSAYGALGGVLVIMLWMNIISQVLFFGAEVCKVTHWRSTGAEPARRAPAGTA